MDNFRARRSNVDWHFEWNWKLIHKTEQQPCPRKNPTIHKKQVVHELVILFYEIKPTTHTQISFGGLRFEKMISWSNIYGQKMEHITKITYGLKLFLFGHKEAFHSPNVHTRYNLGKIRGRVCFHSKKPSPHLCLWLKLCDLFKASYESHKPPPARQHLGLFILHAVNEPLRLKELVGTPFLPYSLNIPPAPPNSFHCGS